MPRFLVLLLAFAPAAAAQIPIGAPSIPVNVNEQDFGSPGSPTDNCWILDMDAAPTAGATSFDLRVAPCINHGPGTEIRDNDTVERSAGYPQANGGAGEGVRYADANSNGRYDTGDYVYITSAPGAGTGLVRTTGTGAWTLRLTATGPMHGGFTAGTQVYAEDADCVAFCNSALDFGPASIGWFDADSTTSYTTGDRAYLMPLAPAAPAGSLVPPGSIRLNAGPQANPTPSIGSSGSPPATPPDGMPGESQAPATSPPPESPDASSRGIPGFGLPAACVALAAQVARNRRKPR